LGKKLDDEVNHSRKGRMGEKEGDWKKENRKVEGTCRGGLTGKLLKTGLITNIGARKKRFSKQSKGL